MAAPVHRLVIGLDYGTTFTGMSGDLEIYSTESVERESTVDLADVDNRGCLPGGDFG